VLLRGSVKWITLCFTLFFLILLISELCTGLVHPQAQPQPPLEAKKILILHSHEADAPVFLDTDKGILTTLQSGGIPSLNQFFESLDLRRNPDPEHRKVLVEEMRMRYSHRKLDMIITMFPEALDFVLKDARDIFPDAPILALYLPLGFELPKTDRCIIGHFPSPDILGTLEIAMKLVPRAKRVYLVSGTHEVDRRIEDQARRDLKNWETQLEFVYLSQMSFEDILASLSTAPPDTIILLLIYTQDVSGRIYTSPSVAQRLSQVSRAPVFGLLEVTLGHGVAGGSLMNFERIGTKAGKLVLDLLRGTAPAEHFSGDLSVPPVPMFDWRQLRHWNLSEAPLPKGSIIINRETTLWDLKYYIMGLLSFCAMETLLIVLLIAERRQKGEAKKSLVQRTVELDQLFNVAIDLLCIADTEGYFLRLNPAVERILGYSREELMAQSSLDFVHPDDLEKTREALSALALQQKVFSFENRYRCKDGTYRWLEWSSAPAGNRIYAAARDVTERKRAEQEAFAANRELMRMERLSRMGELSASLSHELNQPLTAILSNASAALRFLKADKLDCGELEEILQDIVKDNKRAGNVIRSLRAMVKPEDGERELTSINDVLNEMVSLFRSEAIIRNLRVETEFAVGLPSVHANRVQILQVLINLMMNAAESMTRGGSAERVIILQTTASHDGVVKVAVRDFGAGIDEQDRHKIFEPFFTTKRHGLGFGLSLSRSIIESHGGHIWVEDNPDKGTTFYFDLPGITDK
jgi:PAS domain S-box-containing protein